MGLGQYYNNLPLPETIDDIIQEDFYVLEGISGNMLRNLQDPIKFASSTSIYVRRGQCTGDINLMPFTIKAPAIVTIHSTQILQPTAFTDDFEASFLVVSKRFTDAVFVLLSELKHFINAGRQPVAQIPEDCVSEFDQFYRDMRMIIANTASPYRFQAMLFEIAGFFCRTGYRCFPDIQEDDMPMSQGRITNRFLALVQRHFKQERFLEFYASQLDITPKHLSRTVKAQTGFTAVEWIERFVVLEAKGMLKSTNLNVQQIADELNFSSQSFFGKYFKKHVGVSPKEFRNR